MASLAEWHVELRPSPDWHKDLVVAFSGEEMAEVAYTVGYNKGGGGWFLVSGKLGIELRDG